jgi:hypothetical protein
MHAPPSAGWSYPLDMDRSADPGTSAAPLHRVRVAFDFAISGRREVDGMVAQHAALARLLAEEFAMQHGLLPDESTRG